MIDIDSNLIDILRFNAINPRDASRLVDINIHRTNPRRVITYILNKERLELIKKSKQVTEMSTTSELSIDTYDMNVADDYVHEDKDSDWLVIFDNKEIVRHCVVIIGTGVYSKYLAQDGTLIRTRAPEFYHKTRFGEGIKGIDHFESNMISLGCYYRDFDEALRSAMAQANDPNSPIFSREG